MELVVGIIVLLVAALLGVGVYMFMNPSKKKKDNGGSLSSADVKKVEKAIESHALPSNCVNKMGAAACISAAWINDFGEDVYDWTVNNVTPPSGDQDELVQAMLPCLKICNDASSSLI